MDYFGEKINCTEDYLYYLKEKVKIIELYYNYITNKFPSSLGSNNWHINYSGSRLILKNDDKEEVILDKNYKLKYKISVKNYIYFTICPNHVNDSDTYAFMIDNNQNLFYCLGCGIGGNIFDFIMEMYNVDFLSAVKIIGTIDILTYAEVEDEKIIKNRKSLGIPNNLTPDEWKIFFHLTRISIPDVFEKKLNEKRKKIYERIDNYIAKQLDNGRLNNYTDELIEKMAKRICVSAELFKNRLNNFNKGDNNLGINVLQLYHIENNIRQNSIQELQKIDIFLNKFKEYYAAKNNIKLESLKLEFINYGKTELVYVLSTKNGERVTLSVKQPAVEFGALKRETESLTRLKEIDDSVVAPFEYFEEYNQELYITPYIEQARCIASNDTNWGIYIPEPNYRFEKFSEKQEQIVNICMIAKLVSLYDFEMQEGIASCELSGGDFMLSKGWEKEEPTIENTLENLYLTAAREKIKCSFERYLDILRSEFSKATINISQNEVKINKRARLSMEINDIEKGIELGKEIIQNRNEEIKLKRAIY